MKASLVFITTILTDTGTYPLLLGKFLLNSVQQNIIEQCKNVSTTSSTPLKLQVLTS
jgi:hypothetical protein